MRMTTTFIGGPSSSNSLPRIVFPSPPLPNHQNGMLYFPKVYFVLINSTSAARVFRQNHRFEKIYNKYILQNEPHLWFFFYGYWKYLLPIFKEQFGQLLFYFRRILDTPEIAN